MALARNGTNLDTRPLPPPIPLSLSVRATEFCHRLFVFVVRYNTERPYPVRNMTVKTTAAVFVRCPPELRRSDSDG